MTLREGAQAPGRSNDWAEGGSYGDRAPYSGRMMGVGVRKTRSARYNRVMRQERQIWMAGHNRLLPSGGFGSSLEAEPTGLSRLSHGIRQSVDPASCDSRRAVSHIGDRMRYRYRER